MLESVRGAPPQKQGENIDCGATYATWSDGLTVWFDRGEFVGWSLASTGSPLSTAGGLMLGTTRSELENGASVARMPSHRWVRSSPRARWPGCSIPQLPMRG